MQFPISRFKDGTTRAESRGQLRRLDRITDTRGHLPYIGNEKEWERSRRFSENYWRDGQEHQSES